MICKANFIATPTKVKLLVTWDFDKTEISKMDPSVKNVQVEI